MKVEESGSGSEVEVDLAQQLFQDQIMQIHRINQVKQRRFEGFSGMID